MKLENLLELKATDRAAYDAAQEAARAAYDVAYNVGIPTSSDNEHEASFHADVKRFKEKKMNTKELKAAAWADYKKIIAACRDVTDTAWADYIKVAAELKEK